MLIHASTRPHGSPIRPLQLTVCNRVLIVRSLAKLDEVVHLVIESRGGAIAGRLSAMGACAAFA